MVRLYSDGSIFFPIICLSLWARFMSLSPGETEGRSKIFCTAIIVGADADAFSLFMTSREGIYPSSFRAEIREKSFFFMAS